MLLYALYIQVKALNSLFTIIIPYYLLLLLYSNGNASATQNAFALYQHNGAATCALRRLIWCHKSLGDALWTGVWPPGRSSWSRPCRGCCHPTRKAGKQNTTRLSNSKSDPWVTKVSLNAPLAATLAAPSTWRCPSKTPAGRGSSTLWRPGRRWPGPTGPWRPLQNISISHSGWDTPLLGLCRWRRSGWPWCCGRTTSEMRLTEFIPWSRRYLVSSCKRSDQAALLHLCISIVHIYKECLRSYKPVIIVAENMTSNLYFKNYITSAM